MPEIPTAEQRNTYIAEEAIKRSTAEVLQDDQDSYVESELELKSSILLNPKALRINPINVSDIVLGVVKDPRLLRKLYSLLDKQVTMFEAGMNETASFYTNLILSTLNLGRSENGQQQKFIITRLKQQKIELEEEKNKLKNRLKENT